MTLLINAPWLGPSCSQKVVSLNFQEENHYFNWRAHQTLKMKKVAVYGWVSPDVITAMFVHRTTEKKTLLGIRLYYYVNHEPSFVIVLCTNMAVVSRDWKRHIQLKRLWRQLKSGVSLVLLTLNRQCCRVLKITSNKSLSFVINNGFVFFIHQWAWQLGQVRSLYHRHYYLLLF